MLTFSGNYNDSVGSIPVEPSMYLANNSLRIVMVTVTRVHFDIELHRRSHVTYYYTFMLFFDLVV